MSANKQQLSIISNINFKRLTSWEMARLEIKLKCLSELMTNMALQNIFSLSVLAGPSEFNNRQSSLKVRMTKLAVLATTAKIICNL